MFRYSSLSPIDKYSASHVGIVEAVNGNTITTLEGNVDATGADWASTSTFKRKTRYLNDSTVYSFFRPNWKTTTSTTTSGTATGKTTTTSGTATTSNKLYRIQVGAYSNKSNAEVQLAKVKKAGFSDAFIVESKK